MFATVGALTTRHGGGGAGGSAAGIKVADAARRGGGGAGGTSRAGAARADAARVGRGGGSAGAGDRSALFLPAPRINRLTDGNDVAEGTSSSVTLVEAGGRSDTS